MHPAFFFLIIFVALTAFWTTILWVAAKVVSAPNDRLVDALKLFFGWLLLATGFVGFAFLILYAFGQARPIDEMRHVFIPIFLGYIVAVIALVARALDIGVFRAMAVCLISQGLNLVIGRVFQAPLMAAAIFLAQEAGLFKPCQPDVAPLPSPRAEYVVLATPAMATTPYGQIELRRGLSLRVIAHLSDGVQVRTPDGGALMLRSDQIQR